MRNTYLVVDTEESKLNFAQWAFAFSLGPSLDALKAEKMGALQRLSLGLHDFQANATLLNQSECL